MNRVEGGSSGLEQRIESSVVSMWTSSMIAMRLPIACCGRIADGLDELPAFSILRLDAHPFRDSSDSAPREDLRQEAHSPQGERRTLVAIERARQEASLDVLPTRAAP